MRSFFREWITKSYTFTQGLKLFTIIQIYLFGNEKKTVTLNTAAEKNNSPIENNKTILFMCSLHFFLDN